ncbi:MAG TPA: nuclear transport factor 2 family protein [Dehalococcoidia bacterium]|nr:nuclear transport factor 2 family protein [Dehalococcoidia bacterium]
MKLSREQLDEIIDTHFRFEATDDVDGVVASLAEEVEHEVVPSPMGASKDKARIRSYYELLFRNVQGESVTPIRRYYGDDFVIDESMWHGHMDDGAPFLCDGKSGKVSFRLLHVFEVRDGKITREQAWCDLAAIQQQLGCTVS